MMMDIQDDEDVPGPFYLRVYLHVIRQSNGTGGQSIEDVEHALDLLSYAMLEHEIFFVPVCDVSYIDNDEIYGMALSLGCYLWEYIHDDGIDIFFDGPNADTVGGVARDIGSSAFIVGGTWTHNPVGLDSISVIKTHIVAHEMGHCLGLFHTHHGNVLEYFVNCVGDTLYDPNQVPSPPGDTLAPQCKLRGDYVCDTPPDPNIDGFVNSDCEWLATASSFDPDTRNIMSYSNPHCYSYFEDEQGSVMRKMINELSVLQQCVIPSERVVTITSDSSWTTQTFPYNGELYVRDTLLIKSGNAFTIDSGLVIRFDEDALLIIQQNAELHLHGKLSSILPRKSWQGVKVYGDSEESQYFDPQLPGYHHGVLRGYPGSVIENAVTGVELWGPDQDDTGGRILCDGTLFYNNQIGVFFLPYNNFKGSQPHPYIASFKNCEFLVDDALPFTTFHQLVGLYKVDGIRFSGCEFVNGRGGGQDYQHDFGYGIAAVDAGFIVGASFSQSGDICEGSCQDLVPSTFYGLGFGIWTGSFEKNNLFRVYQSQFQNCFTGIEVNGVSAGVMLFNSFEMGTVPDDNVLNRTQIGIKLNHQIAGFTIEENTFTAESGNVENTIGIAAENLGEFSNVIRKNSFSGLTIANEAFGINAKMGNELDGLRYVCNTNSNTYNKDFFVVDSLYTTTTDEYVSPIRTQSGRVMKLSPDGMLEWSVIDTAFFHPELGSRSYLTGVTESPSGSVYAVGWANNYDDHGVYRSFGWLLKITADGCVDTLCTTTSLLEEIRHREQMVKIYPNPASGFVIADLHKQVSGDAFLEIIDITGRLVLTQWLAAGEQQIDLDNMVPGIYVWRLVDDSGRIVSIGKIVIEE